MQGVTQNDHVKGAAGEDCGVDVQKGTGTERTSRLQVTNMTASSSGIRVPRTPGCVVFLCMCLQLPRLHSQVLRYLGFCSFYFRVKSGTESAQEKQNRTAFVEGGGKNPLLI